MARKRADKEEYEYVSLRSPDLVVTDTKLIEKKFKECLHNTMEELKLHREKHKLVARAKEIANNLRNDIDRFEKHAKYGLFEETVKHNGVKKKVKKYKMIEKDMETISKAEEDYFVSGKRALKNLKGNIADVKKLLGTLD
jgi:hypothetical protein